MSDTNQIVPPTITAADLAYEQGRRAGHTATGAMGILRGHVNRASAQLAQDIDAEILATLANGTATGSGTAMLERERDRLNRLAEPELMNYANGGQDTDGDVRYEIHNYRDAEPFPQELRRTRTVPVSDTVEEALEDAGIDNETANKVMDILREHGEFTAVGKAQLRLCKVYDGTTNTK